MSEHTKEPWVADHGIIYSKDIGIEYGYQIAIIDHEHSDFSANVIAANARRIVACVNACAGQPTELLEEAGTRVFSHHESVVMQYMQRAIDLGAEDTAELHAICGAVERSDEECSADVTRRVIACVNACKHISTESLESGMQQNLIMRARDAEDQRDALATEFAAYKEGSEEAFNAVVEQKHALSALCDGRLRTINTQQQVIRDALTAEFSAQAAERLWEQTMMELVGEDGVVSAAAAVRIIKEQRDALLAAVGDGFLVPDNLDGWVTKCPECEEIQCGDDRNAKHSESCRLGKAISEASAVDHIIDHISYAVVHEEPPKCKTCGCKMFSGLLNLDECAKCREKGTQS